MEFWGLVNQKRLAGPRPRGDRLEVGGRRAHANYWIHVSTRLTVSPASLLQSFSPLGLGY